MDDLTEQQHSTSRQHGFDTHLSRIGLCLVGSICRAKNDRCAGGRLAKYLKTLSTCGRETVIHHQEMEPFGMQCGEALVGTSDLRDSTPVGGAVF